MYSNIFYYFVSHPFEGIALFKFVENLKVNDFSGNVMIFISNPSY